MPISAEKAKRLRALSSPTGIISALAMDQRKSLRRMIAEAAGVPLDDILDEQLIEFKASVSKILSPHATAILLDPEYGLTACGLRGPNCGLLLTYEADGYDNPRPHRMLALMPEYSVRRLRDLGALGIKILLSWTPFDNPKANDQKRELIERIGAECAALDMPFFLEPVGYDPGGSSPNSLEWAKRKPEVVIRSMEEFSKPEYQVDVLKVEFPINVAFLDQGGCTRPETLAYFRQADAAARVPYIYLSAGVGIEQFLDSLGLAVESQSHFSGVLCGRATWQNGIGVFVREGPAALEVWLASEGARNMQAIASHLRHASPWNEIER